MSGNVNGVFKTLGATSHSQHEREPDDYYATDPKAIDKLLSVAQLNTRIWECACGGGHLSERLTEHGFYVCSTDIKDRGYKRLSVIKDFLKAKTVPFNQPFDIVTNPPYRYAKEFVIKALELLPHGGKCCMLLRLQFLEGKARYEEIFRTTPPRRVYVFSERLQCAKNGDFEQLKTSGGSAIAYAWFVWVKGCENKTTTVNWIRKAKDTRVIYSRNAERHIKR